MSYVNQQTLSLIFTKAFLGPDTGFKWACAMGAFTNCNVHELCSSPLSSLWDASMSAVLCGIGSQIVSFVLPQFLHPVIPISCSLACLYHLLRKGGFLYKQRTFLTTTEVMTRMTARLRKEKRGDDVNTGLPSSSSS
jgi:hypothetical protein